MELKEMSKYYLTPLLLLFSLYTSAQTATVRGIIRDASTREALVGVNVYTSATNATTTNSSGSYELKVPAGEASLIFSYIGYAADTVQVTLEADKIKTLNNALGNTDIELNTVVVSTSKFGKKIQKESVSMEVLKPRFIETNNITSALQAVARVPGITLLDGSISIRGGSGYSYGSGSRVVLVIDDMPLLTPDRGEIKWELAPMENMSQMEIIKGASTVQYGVGALNGVIHLRTAYPTDTPETRINMYTEVVDANSRVLHKDWQVKSDYAWWQGGGRNYFQTAQTTGFNFLHKRKITSELDFVISGNLHEQQSHLQNEHDKRVRFTGKLRYSPKKLNGRLTLGLSSTIMYRKSGFQFWWKGIANPYISADGVSLDERYFYAIVDPSITFIDKKQNSHRLLTRWFYQNNVNSADGPRTHFGTIDYQFRHDFGSIAKLFIGVTNNHFTVTDGNLGQHSGDNGGIYAAADINWKKLTVNIGVRAEYLRLDKSFGIAGINFTKLKNRKDGTIDTTRVILPVPRLGLNYQIRKYNYLRASVGFAYRFPSIAERFVQYDLGNLSVLPNPNVKPETGFTVELGYKRSINIRDWRGYFDAVVFWNEFYEMVEFQIDSLGFKQDPLTGKYTPIPYFRSLNVTRARIFGWETSIVGEGKIGKADITAQIGYTYLYPQQIDTANDQDKILPFLKRAFTTFYKPTDAEREGMLKYRTRHSLKADIDVLLYKKYRIGTSVQYYSYMDNIDQIFLSNIPDLKQQREQDPKTGYAIWDIRMGYEVSKNVALNFAVKNVMNTFYTLRPARPSQPRAFNFQCTIRI
jgi:outer membrane receptor protein involved in Fe transport